MQQPFSRRPLWNEAREISETIVEINELRKLFLNFQELKDNREWTQIDANTLKTRRPLIA